MKRKKLKKFLKGFNGITEEEWNAIKPYIEHKLSVHKKFTNSKLIYVTLKHFFIKVEK